MAGEAEGKSSRASQIAWFVAKAAGGGLISYAAPRFLVALGVPIDRWIIAMGGALNLTSDAALWAATLVIGLVLYGLLLWGVWKPRYRDRYHEKLKAQTAPVASLAAEFTSAPRSPVADRANWESNLLIRDLQRRIPGLGRMPDADFISDQMTPGRRDMPFKQALRHFAYESRWAHDFKHPTGDWMTAVHWAEAVLREFCQPLIDNQLAAWGVRQVRGKARENGLSKISPDFWRTAQFDVATILEDPETKGGARDEDGVLYADIVFMRPEVEQVWPAVEGEGESVIEQAAKAWRREYEKSVRHSQEMIERQVEAARRAREERDAERDK